MAEKTLYTVQRCRLKDDVFYGPICGSNDGYSTLCECEINERWVILTNEFDGEITCKKCISKLKKGER